MIAQANVTHMLVGKASALATTSDTRDDLDEGQIGVFLAGSETATTSALSTGNKFRIAFKKSDGYVIDTPLIEYDNISSKSSLDTADLSDATQSSLYAGFNGSTGSIDATDSEDYVLHYKYFDNTTVFGYGKPNKIVAYQSGTSATQVEIANGLAASVNLNSKKEGDYPVAVAKLLINDAGAVLTGTGDLTAVKGSTYLTAATDADAVLSVGDFVRLGTASGAALTDAAYEVISFPSDGEYIELSRAFTGDSATYTIANCDYIAAATAATADAGMVMTAGTQPFLAGRKKYSQTNLTFDIIGDGLGSTSTGVLAYGSKGVGTYEEIAEVEWFLKANRGESYRVADYPIDNTLEATSGKSYELINFNYKNTNARAIDRDIASYASVIIASEDTSAGHDSLKTVLGIS